MCCAAAVSCCTMTLCVLRPCGGCVAPQHRFAAIQERAEELEGYVRTQDSGMHRVLEAAARREAALKEALLAVTAQDEATTEAVR